MFERLTTPAEVLGYNLGATLKMERKVLDMLEDNAQEAHDQQIAALFRHHRDETQRQVANIERAFDLLGWKVDTAACPAIDGLEKEGKSLAKKTDDEIVDSVLLQAAAEVEHHEIGVYENLIASATAMGRGDVATLLRENLDQEQHTLGEVKAMQPRVLAAAPKSV